MGTAIARATPSIVTSSCVGPTPPEVKTTSKSRLCAVTSRAISSTSSGTTEIRRTSTPSWRSSRQRYAALTSAILPDRISLPMRMMPAVFGIVSRDSITGGPRCYNASVTDGVPVRLTGWALILGVSSGFGEATSLALARAGINIFGVHLDRKATLPNAERLLAAIRALGREARFFNVNAADPDRRAEVVGEMERVLAGRGDGGTLRVLLHSLAFGTLKPYIANQIGRASCRERV